VLYGNLHRHLGEVLRKLAEQKERRVEEGIFGRTRTHDGLDPGEVFGVGDGEIYQGQESNSPCAGLN
jgi:hypothetical protein